MLLVGIRDVPFQPNGSFIDLKIDVEALQIAAVLTLLQASHDLLRDLAIVAASTDADWREHNGD